MSADVPSSNSWLRLAPIAVFLLIAGFFAAALTTGDPSKIPSAMLNKPVPVATFPAIEGLQVEGRDVAGFATSQLADGKVKLVNFWASWCGPCVEEHPQLVAIARQTGLDIFGVNYKDSAQNARRFISRYGNPYAAIGADESGRRAIDWGVYGMPETFLVDGRGNILYKHVGPISPESFGTQLLPRIERAKTAAAKP